MTDDNIKDFEEFFSSDKRTMFVSGNSKWKKIEVVMDYIFNNLENNTILFRTNKLGNIDNVGIPSDYVKTKKVAGKKYSIEKNEFYFDSMLTISTWNKFQEPIDVAIVYPVDSLYESKQEECIQDLLENEDINKIIFVSWVENKDLSYFYNSNKIVFINE